jgi:hypothetical protein
MRPSPVPRASRCIQSVCHTERAQPGTETVEKQADAHGLTVLFRQQRLERLAFRKAVLYEIINAADDLTLIAEQFGQSKNHRVHGLGVIDAGKSHRYVFGAVSAAGVHSFNYSRKINLTPFPKI